MQNRLIFIAHLVAAANGNKTKENFEKSANGSKERVTINACSNANGMVKMLLQVIGKANHVAITVVDHTY